MILNLAEGLWIADSGVMDPCSPINAGKGRTVADTLRSMRIDGLLNTAKDLQSHVGWLDRIDHMQIGLVDGPGNPPAAYNAAILALTTLCERCDNVMVYCHDGGRALAVALMYLSLKGGQRRPSVTGWSHWLTWDEIVCEVGKDKKLPKVHAAHIEAYAKIPFGLLEALL